MIRRHIEVLITLEDAYRAVDDQPFMMPQVLPAIID
jgi:hypothetical protein